MANIVDYEVDRIRHSWTENDVSTDDAIITVTHAAQASRHHMIQKVDASFSDVTASGLLTVKFGTVTVGRKHIHGAGALDFSEFGHQNPNAGEAVSATLAAGGSGVIGCITMTGYTTGPLAGD